MDACVERGKGSLVYLIQREKCFDKAWDKQLLPSPNYQ